jgi:cell pole-organizing protein PopZ
MAQAAKNQEPSMEEILASIRRIIAEEDPDKSQQHAAESTDFDLGAGSAAPAPNDTRDAEPSYSAPTAAARSEPETTLPPAGDIGAASKATAKPNRSSTILDLTESMAAGPARPPEPTFVSNAKISNDKISNAAVSSTKGSNAKPGRPSLRPELVHGAEASFDAVETKETFSGLTPSGVGHNDEARGLMSATTSAAVDSAFNALAQTVLVQNARTLEDLVREMLRPMLKVWLDDNLPGLVERLVRAEIERVSRGRAD